MQQIAMGHVQLDHLEAEAHRPPRRRGEGVPDAGEVGVRRRVGRVPVLVMRQVGGGEGGPRLLIRRERLPALPGTLRRALAPAWASCTPNSAPASRRRAPRPAPAPAPARCRRCRGRRSVRDAPVALHGGRLDDDLSAPGHREVHDMLQMPIRHAAVGCGVLAHRRDRDAVGAAIRPMATGEKRSEDMGTRNDLEPSLPTPGFPCQLPTGENGRGKRPCRTGACEPRSRP